MASVDLWMVVIVAGVVAGSIGPLPYNIQECVRRADQQNVRLEQAWERGLRAEGVTLDNTFFVCMHRNIRPMPSDAETKGKDIE